MTSDFPLLRSPLDQILGWGLGRLGQHWVANLKTFGIRVNAIELQARDRGEIEE